MPYNKSLKNERGTPTALAAALLLAGSGRFFFANNNTRLSPGAA